LPVIEKLTSDYNLNHTQMSNLFRYVELLKKWSSSYNLMGPNEIDRIWERHILDSLQLINYLPPLDSNPTIIDLGSGAGFPGVIFSLIGFKNVHLVEKSRKKSLFLETVSRETKTPFQVHNCRIEDLSPPLQGDVITSRALANLTSLLMYSESILSEDGDCLFLKGEKVDPEILEAQKKYFFEFEKIVLSPNEFNVLLKIWNLKLK